MRCQLPSTTIPTSPLPSPPLPHPLTTATVFARRPIATGRRYSPTRGNAPRGGQERLAERLGGRGAASVDPAATGGVASTNVALGLRGGGGVDGLGVAQAGTVAVSAYAGFLALAPGVVGAAYGLDVTPQLEWMLESAGWAMVGTAAVLYCLTHGMLADCAAVGYGFAPLALSSVKTLLNGSPSDPHKPPSTDLITMTTATPRPRWPHSSLSTNCTTDFTTIDTPLFVCSPLPSSPPPPPGQSRRFTSVPLAVVGALTAGAYWMFTSRTAVSGHQPGWTLPRASAHQRATRKRRHR